MSVSPWLSSVANLLVFFRWLAVWLDVVVFGISLPPLNIMAVCIFGLTGVATVYNLTVALVQRSERKRTAASGVVPVPSLAVIIFDYLFGALYLVAWILSSFIFHGYIYRHYSSGYTYYYRADSIFETYSTVGCLVAVHFHLFLAGVSTHIRRRQAQGVVIPIRIAQAAADIKTNQAEQNA